MATRRVLRTPRTAYGRTPGQQSKSKRSWANPDKIKWLVRGGLLLVALITGWQFLRISTIEIRGQHSLSADHLKDQAQQTLREHPFSSNLLTVSLASMESQLLRREPRLKSVKMSRRWPNSIQLQIVERQSGLLWRTGDQAYLVDVEGVAVGILSPGTANIMTVIDQANLPVKVGERVVPARFVAFCAAVVEGLPKRTNLHAKSLLVPQSISELYVVTDKGFTIKFDTSRDIGEELGDLVSVMFTLASIKKVPAEYIDLRIAHKAYYR